MDPRTARRLRILGLGVLTLFFIFSFFPAANAMMEDRYKDALAATLTIGIGLLLLAEIGPLIKSLKAGGVEIGLVESVGSKFNEFETRLTHLELAAANPKRTIQDIQAREPKPAPALSRKKCRRDDPWKGRFGGEAAANGLRLSAEFKIVGDSLVQIWLKVTAEDAKQYEGLECVEFYLHDTFDPCVVPAVFHDGKAELSVIAYGGFTAGAWIPCLDTELELDLAELPTAPRIVREN